MGQIKDIKSLGLVAGVVSQIDVFLKNVGLRKHPESVSIRLKNTSGVKVKVSLMNQDTIKYPDGTIFVDGAAGSGGTAGVVTFVTDNPGGIAQCRALLRRCVAQCVGFTYDILGSSVGQFSNSFTFIQAGFIRQEETSLNPLINLNKSDNTQTQGIRQINYAFELNGLNDFLIELDPNSEIQLHINVPRFAFPWR